MMIRRTILAAVVAAAGSIASAGALAVTTSAPGETAASAEAAVGQALKKGDRAPEVSFTLTSGEDVALYDMLEDGPVVLIFYRGAWCPFCKKSLVQFKEMNSSFESAGAQILATSPEKIGGAKNVEKTIESAFDVTRDENSDAARAFGVSYSLGKAPRIERANGSSSGKAELPLGATYVIDTDGTIAYAYIEESYRERADPKDVLEVVEDL